MTAPPVTSRPAVPGRPPGAPLDSTSAGRSGFRRSWQSWGWSLGIIIVIVIGGILTVLLTPQPPAWPLDPASTGPGGAHALADLLAGRGVTVTRAGSAGAAVAAARRAPATVVVTSPWQLTGPQLATLRQAPGDLVVVGPDPASLRALAPEVTISGYTTPVPTRPGCGLSAARLAGDALLGGAILRTRAPAAARCYAPAGAPPGGAALVREAASGRTVTVLGAGTMLTNHELASNGDAALALNLLSSRSRVVWLVPGEPLTGAAAPPGRSVPGASLIPPSALPVVAELVIAAILAALWRMRRFGPLIAEPLPVVVRAAETTEGHARLYQSRHARGRAAAALRTAVADRLLPRLGLPRGAPADVVCGELAHRTGRSTGQIEAILYGPVPRDDGALVRLAADLDTLEGEVLIQ